MGLPYDARNLTFSENSMAIIANNYFQKQSFFFGKSKLIFKFKSFCYNSAHYQKNHEVEWKYNTWIKNNLQSSDPWKMEVVSYNMAILIKCGSQISIERNF